jgi:hypothetical protein
MNADTPMGVHCVHVQCPRCHGPLDLSVGGRHFETWDAVREGRVVTCIGCGLQYFAQPIIDPGYDRKRLERLEQRLADRTSP